MADSPSRPLQVTDVVLRDAQQSLLATRMRLADMLPIAEKLDQVGFWSLETWGGATFDAALRYLGEDPWERIRELKRAMPNTPQQMLLRGQNLLGYRHYADDLVDKFVERAAVQGVDVFRIFDAMNDPRNLDRAIQAVRHQERHAQAAMSYTVSPVHSLHTWVEMAVRLEGMGADSIAIKDMAGLLRPYTAYDLVTRLKERLSIPLYMQSHATTGLSTATIVKAVEAGIDGVDTAISSMSMTYGHSPTETLVCILDGTERATGLDLDLLEEIAGYFRTIRAKYARFEGDLKGVDARILVAQVPGGMLSNMTNQLREQKAEDRFDEVLLEIPSVRKELGYIPLVTPTSQIVGTQAVINVLRGERYQTITKETAEVLRGGYGRTPAPVDKALQERVLEGNPALDCRPADLLEPEFAKLREQLSKQAAAEGFSLANEEDDTLSYALFPQVALKFFAHRGDPAAFEPEPGAAEPARADSRPESVPAASRPAAMGRYQVRVDGHAYLVEVAEDGTASVQTTASGPAASGAMPPMPQAAPAAVRPVPAPLGGMILKVLVQPGEKVEAEQLLLTMEAMKMETEIRSPAAGQVVRLEVGEGDEVAAGTPLLTLG